MRCCITIAMKVRLKACLLWIVEVWVVCYCRCCLVFYMIFWVMSLMLMVWRSIGLAYFDVRLVDLYHVLDVDEVSSFLCSFGFGVSWNGTFLVVRCLGRLVLGI